MVIKIPGANVPRRWITTEDFSLYKSAFQLLTIPENQVIPNFEHQPVKLQPDATILPLHRILNNFISNHVIFTTADIHERYPIDTEELTSFLEQVAASDQLLKIPATADMDEDRWGKPELLERARRVTLRLQHQQIKPCDPSDFQNYLFKWHHIAEESRLTRYDDFLELMEQYQGLFLPAEIWETQVIRKRMTVYNQQWLDELILSGELIWYGDAAGSGDRGNLAFSFKEDLPLFYRYNNKQNDADSAEAIHTIRRILKNRGASFLNDVVMETGLSSSICQTALWEMIWRGEVTNDSFAVIRSGKPAPITTDLQRSSLHSRKGRMDSYRYRSRMRLTGGGRWSLLPDAAEAYSDSETVEKISRQMLRRHGLLSRELYDQKLSVIPWDRLYDSLVKMEWRGEIKRGYFVSSLSGVQFATPETAAALTSSGQENTAGSRHAHASGEHYTLLNTCDPANMYGAASPFPLLHPRHLEWRLLRHPHNFLIYLNGSPIISIEAKGSRLTPLRDLAPDQLAKALSLLPRLLDEQTGWNIIRSLKVELWDQQPIRNTAVVSILKELGFRNEFKMMILEKSM